MCDTERRDLDVIADPGERAAAAQHLIDDATKAAETVYEYAVPIRRDAVRELKEAGFGHTRLAALLGVSRTRAQQLAKDAEAD